MSDRPEKTFIVIASLMRSGSTMLKALLATADDVSDLPETNFQKFDAANAQEAQNLCKERIAVLKRPCWFNEVGRYPKVPDLADTRILVLVRDVYDTVASVKKMALGPAAPIVGRLFDGMLCKGYWHNATQSLLNLSKQEGLKTHLVRYEDLTKDPINTTAEIFEFIGSSQQQGITRYNKPGNYSWKWGTDDGGENIKSLEVKDIKRPQTDQRLLKTIAKSESVQSLRVALGYATGETQGKASKASS